jgi:aspartyl-tRNA(Asn)/glutamyl-tRNA(Gln) amidotransferase subunit B
MMSELARALNERGVGIEQAPVDAERLAGLVSLVARRAITGPTAKHVFEAMVETGATADEIVAREGLATIDDEASLMAHVRDVIAAHPGPVAQYRGGKTQAIGFLVGQVMRLAGSKANPKRVNELLARVLDEQA